MLRNNFLLILNQSEIKKQLDLNYIPDCKT